MEYRVEWRRKRGDFLELIETKVFPSRGKAAKSLPQSYSGPIIRVRSSRTYIVVVTK